MQYNDEQSRSLYTRASIIVFGGVCAVLMANLILSYMSDWNAPSIFPGFRYMAELCYPILYFWIGLLFRSWVRISKWWVQFIYLCLSISCFYQYLAKNLDFVYRFYYSEDLDSYRFFYLYSVKEWIGIIYVAMAGLGFLISPKVIAYLKCNKGWISLMMLILSVFCYTVLETTRQRLLLGPVMKPEFKDMELMLETILIYAEPFMMIVVSYFIIQFAFSQVSQYLGSQSWFRGMIAVPCIFMFIGEIIRLFNSDFLYMVDFVYYTPLQWFIVQPITIYLIIVGFRCIKNFCKEKNKRKSWKEMLYIDK